MGADGYRHYQGRLGTSNRNYFEWCKANIPALHVEKAATDNDEYERKTGFYISSTDYPENRKVRFGTPTQVQQKILKIVEDQNDREIDVFLDKRGSTGKTWLSQYLWERGSAYYVPRSVADSGRVSADVCSNLGQERYIIIDLQRDAPIPKGYYALLEELKDGIVSDPRYHGKQRNIRGRKLIIFTNKEFDTKKLSRDRWRLHGVSEKELDRELHERKKKRRDSFTP